MNPMPDTPAGRAGLKRFDRIIKINNESTLNMPLDDAVQHLRGEPGTKVTVWVHRDGDERLAGPKPFELTREADQGQVASSARCSSGDVGYVRLKQFQSELVGRARRRARRASAEGAELKGAGPRPARQPRRPARSGGAASPTSSSSTACIVATVGIVRGPRREARARRGHRARTTRSSCW